MNELTQSEARQINGGISGWYELGYDIGYAAGYFYENVMIGNGVIDDLAKAVR
ncbi:hypothetical protein [Alteromonas sp. 14N.309.X.WAT.G.H12]|uniref:hypothetical protein n=1 Tax=Alteromonas sp. 14N.309.X.WAT.G.H12 TaxID=3120824 RepID=UPI002FD00B00